MSQLTFAGVEKRYGDVVALAGLDLRVEEGELLARVGPSGSGKTTALRIAAGLEGADAGAVEIGGRDVSRVAPGKRAVAMVFQSYALFPHLTVEENIGFGLAARGVRDGRRDRVRRAAAIAGCAGLLGRRPGQLSGGERQRVALARALASEPSVFLLDEPLSNLDAQLRVEVRTELKALHQRIGATMLHVTHDQVEALTLGDRVAVLRAGSLQQVGSPEEVYRRPANRFVATFVGSPAMNVLPAEVVDGALRAGPFAFAPPAAAAGRRVEVGLRPEHVRLEREAGEAAAEVRVVEDAGHERYVHLDAGGRHLVARAAPEFDLAVGERVTVGARAADLHLFDADTGAALR